MRRMLKYLIALLVIVVLTGCNAKNSAEVDKDSNESKESFSICDTTHMDGVLTEISETELTFENGAVFLEITTTGDFKSYFKAYIDGKFYFGFECNERDSGMISQTGLRLAYADITKDGAKDVVIVIPPVRGTLTGPCLTYVYDVKEDKQIDLFEEDGSLTDKQLESVKKLLDDEFL